MGVITATSGLTPLINQQQEQVKVGLQRTQSAIQQAKQQAGAIARTVLSGSVTASGVGNSLDLRA